MRTVLLTVFLSLAILSRIAIFASPAISINGLHSQAVVLQVTPTASPTFSLGEEPVPARTGPPLTLTVTLLAICCAFLILIGVVVLGFVVRRENRMESHKE